MFSKSYIEKNTLIIYCGQTVSGLSETVGSLPPDALRVIALMDVYPHELPPKEFELYLKERNKGVEFARLSQFDFAESGEMCIFMQAGQQLNQDVLEYAGYFFKDSGCPLLFVPVLGEGEALPKEFFCLPAGSITDNLALLVKYNFICVTTKPSLLYGQDYTTALVQAAKQVENFGVLTMSTCTGISIARNFNANDLYNAASNIDHNPKLSELINDYILSQVSLAPVETDNNIDLLLPYISLEKTSNEARPRIHITKVSNNFTQADIEGYFYASSKDDKLFYASESVKLSPIVETMTDKLYPRYYFNCTINLADMKAGVVFECEKGTIDNINLADDCQRNYAVSVKGSNLEIEKLAARPNYLVTCIIPVHNGEQHLAEAIESVINGMVDFFLHVQIVLVNDGSTDETHNICSQYAGGYTYNIHYIQQEHKGVSAARTAGMRHAMGKYIIFLDADDTFDDTLINHGVKHLEDKQNADIDFIAFPIKMFGIENPPTPDWDYRFSENGLVDIRREPDKVQFSACGVLMRTSAVKDLAFNSNLTIGEDAEFMCRALSGKHQYLVCKDAFYNYRVSHNKYIAAYRESVPLAKALVSFFGKSSGDMTQYAQHVLMHNLRRIVLDGTYMPASTAGSARREEVMASLTNTIGYVDDAVIHSARLFTPQQREYMLYIKHGDISIKGDAFFAGDCQIRAFIADAHIDYMRERRGNLVIAGYFHLPKYDNIELIAVYGGQEYLATISPDSRLAVTVYDWQVSSARSFEISIPLADIHDEGHLLLRIKTGSTYGNASITFADNFIFIGKNVIAAPSPDSIKLTASTMPNISAALSTYNGSKDVIKEYLDVYPLLHDARIWLFIDCGDSKGGLEQSAVYHMYKFCRGKDEGINKRIVLPAGEMALHDYDDNILASGSQTYLLMCMFAEKIFVSDIADIARIQSQVGLINAEFIFLPNDVLTQQDMPMLTGLVGAPVEMVSIMSETELALLPPGPIRDAAQVLGNPKYDSLTDNKQPRILFMPSYRKHLYIGPNEFNPAFKYSEYVMRVGDLLLEERILDVADALGISVDFAPHEKVSLQRSDFEMDDSVKIIPPGLPRLNLCQNAAILITDTLPAHSFAYLDKPVIYYQFDSDGNLPQDGARFGDYVDDFESLVKLLVEYMTNNFELKPEHKACGDAFFSHKDGNSCKRIYTRLTEVKA